MFCVVFALGFAGIVLGDAGEGLAYILVHYTYLWFPALTQACLFRLLPLKETEA